MRLSSGVAGLVFLAGCGDSGTDRPACNAGRICGDGDADADTDADADSDADADADSDLDCPVDADLDGLIDDRCEGGTDCHDDDPAAHPGAEEVCNGIDDDCVGGVDEGMLAAGEDVVLESDGVTHLISLASGASGFGLLTLVAGDIYCGGDRALSFYELRPDGGVQSGPILISETPECRYDHTLSVAPLATGWIVAWADAPLPLGPSPGRDGVVQAAVVSGAEVTGPVDVGDPASRGDFSPVIAVSPDDGALVVWNHDPTELRYSLRDPDDLTSLAEGSLGPSPGNGGRPSVVWTGAVFLVASEIGNDQASVFVVNPDGTAGTAREMGHNYWDSPVLAWDGSEAGYSQFDNAQQQFFRLGARGEGGALDPIQIDAGGKAQRMAGWGGAFALTAVVSADGNNLRGELHFWSLSPGGIASNDIAADDSSSTASADPWVVPTEPAGSWALAWIGDDHQVRIDFVGCVQ
jgi:hypothetical protein